MDFYPFTEGATLAKVCSDLPGWGGASEKPDLTHNMGSRGWRDPDVCMRIPSAEAGTLMWEGLNKRSLYAAVEPEAVNGKICLAAVDLEMSRHLKPS